jgi:Uma2 family endonuclease
VVSNLQSSTQAEIIYPESDGRPMADNTKQFGWIVVVKENLEALFADRSDVFVAGDLLWYPVEGNNKLCTAPDAMVVFGRPKGDRGSYQQWKEGNIPPQVVFEILSPGNTRQEMEKKLLFYDRYGVEEYYIYDPDDNQLQGWLRSEMITGLDAIPDLTNWVSPRLQIRFELSDPQLIIYRPDGKPFLTYTEITNQLEQVSNQLEQVSSQLSQAEQRAMSAEQARTEAIPRLAAMGLSAEQIAEALGLEITAVQVSLSE